MLIDNILDILKHTSDLGIFSVLKIYSDETATHIEALSDDTSVNLKGTLKTKLDDFGTSAVGMNRLSVIYGYANFPGYSKSGTAKLTINKKDFSGNSIPEEMIFSTGEGFRGVYRFMSPIAISDLVVRSVPISKWNVVVKPSMTALNDLRYMKGVLGSYESTFSVRMDEGTLNFAIGQSSGDRTIFPFAKNVEGSLNSNWTYKLKDIISVLKLADTDDTTMYISERGFIKLEMNSGFGTYSYTLAPENI